jgi:hypothetical protein
VRKVEAADAYIWAWLHSRYWSQPG